MTFKIDTVNLVGKQGVTFTPRISPSGVLSWSNDGGLDNPKPLLIKGEDLKPNEEIVKLNELYFSNSFRKSTVLVQKIGNMVYISGIGVCLDEIPSDSVLFTLSDNFRPSVDIVSSFGSVTREVTVIVGANGNVTLSKGNFYTNMRFDINIMYSLIDMRGV